VVGYVLQRQGKAQASASPGALTALALSGALLLSPYLHLNDLLLLALPLLVIATAPLTLLGRITLVVWAVGTSVNLLLAFAEAQLLHAPRPGGPAGFGLVLTVLAFAAVAAVAGRGSDLTSASGLQQPSLVSTAQ
jgi:hypothetical protein